MEKSKETLKEFVQLSVSNNKDAVDLIFTYLDLCVSQRRMKNLREDIKSVTEISIIDNDRTHTYPTNYTAENAAIIEKAKKMKIFLAKNYRVSITPEVAQKISEILLLKN
jgi:hypothetical protein